MRPDGVGGPAPHVLVVQHEECCPPGMLRPALLRAGAVVDVVRPDLGVPLPTALGRRGPGRPPAAHDALVVLGGTAGAGDDTRWPWLPAVRALLAACVDDGTPALGVCLGAQLLAAATGGRTGRCPGGPETGLLAVDVEPGADDDPLVGAARPPGGEPWRVVQSHEDAVLAVPPGGRVLARSRRGDPAVAAGDGVVQVFRVGPAWGLQHHPEAGAAVVDGWWRTPEGRADVASQGLDADALVAEVDAAAPGLAAAADRLAAAFVAVVRDARDASGGRR